jgi:hypothetical protein
MKLVKFCWRVIAGVLRRAGALATKLADRSYSKSLPGLSSEERKLIAANAIFRNRHLGQRCFIIGNGPSIRNQDLSRLAGEITFVMNAFWKHDVVKEWQPSYYFLSDGLFFDRSSPSKEFFEGLQNRVDKTVYFAPLSQRIVVSQEGLLPEDSTLFFSTQRRFLGEDWEDSLDFSRPVPDVYTVAQLAIMAAMYLGCSPIYLMGLDHDWLGHHGEKDYYFYKGLALKDHPGNVGRLGPYDQEMESMLACWKGYRKLQAIAEKRGIRILNATDGGFLDVFERVPYRSLIEPSITGVRTA